MTNTNDSTRRAPSRKQQVRAAATLTVVGGSLVINGQPVSAATFTVTNTNATGPGSLLEAVDLANANADLDTITFAAGAAGTINIGAETLNLKYDVDIVGPGTGVVTLTNSAGDVIYLYNDVNASISGLTIDQAADDAISGNNFLSASVSDVDITSPVGNGLDLNRVGVSVGMTNVSVSDAGSDGAELSGRYGGNIIGPVSMTLAEVIVTNSASYGVDLSDVDLVTISDSMVTQSGDRGIEVYPLRGSATITDTDVSDSGDDGIYFDGDDPAVGTVTLERVNVANSDSIGVFLRGDQALVLTDVTVDDSGGKGIRITDYASAVTMNNVTVNRTASDGIELYAVDGDVSLTGVTVNDAGSEGILIGYVDSDFAGVNGDVELTDVTVSRTGSEGIVIGVAYYDNTTGVIGDVTLSNVSVSEPEFHGVVIGVAAYDDTTGVTGDVTLTNVSVSDAASDGIVIGEGDGTYSTGINGIVSLSDVSVTDAYSEGIVIGDSDGSNSTGINGAVTLSNVSVDNPRLDGIVLGGGGGYDSVGVTADVALSNVSVSEAGSDGIEIGLRYGGVSGSVELTLVTVTDSGSSGIDIGSEYGGVGGDLAFDGVSVAGSADIGIEVYNTQGDVMITGSTVADSGELGLRLYDTSGTTTIENSTITGSGTRAIEVNQSGLTTISNSTITQNDVYLPNLIAFTDTDGVIESSTITGNTLGNGNGGDALRVDNSNVAVSNSVLTNNGGLNGFDVVSGGTADANFSLLPTTFSGTVGTNVLTNDPVLGALGDNGGYTETMLPLSGSPALNGGDPAITVGTDTDQRGVARVAGGRLDIGSVEVDGGLLAVGDVTVAEDGGSVDVAVTRSGTADLAASVDVGTVAGTATAGADFTATTATVSWANGETGPKTVTVPILVDEEVEGDEQFTVVLTNAAGAVVSDAEGVVTITDVVPLPDGAFTPLAPTRFADTRPAGMTFDGDSQATGKLAADGEIIVKIADRGDVPADAVGVVMNVTAVQAEAVGFVTVHGCEDPRPNASSLNYTPGVNIGNEVIAGLAADGTVCLYSSAAAHLTVDVVGFVSASSPVVNVVPGRVLDTRAAGETVDEMDQGAGKTAAESTTTLKVADRAGVPADAAAVIVNVTAVGPTETGFVTVTPCVSPLPKASSLNHVAGVNRANELVASLDADGQICLFTSSSVHLLVDVVGYLPAGSDVTGVDPARFLDTRAAGETVDEMSQAEGKLEADEEYTLQVAGRGVVPMGAKAVIVNVTAIQAEGNGFITTHPCLDPRPLSSSLNYVPGVNGGNEIVALLSDDGTLCLYTSQAAHLTVDVVAYIG